MTKDEIARQDLEAFKRELLQPSRMGALAFGFVLLVLAIAFMWPLAILVLAGIGGALWDSWKESERRRFHHRRFRSKWKECLDRLSRLDKSMAKARGAETEGLKELPPLVSSVSHSVYRALRKADMALVEIAESEGFRLNQPPTIPPQSSDPTAARLWAASQKEEEEYRRHLQSILAGVERTEAQAALYVATLDTLRVKVLGARLAGGGSGDFESKEAMAGIVEVRSQLKAIDEALEELGSAPFAEIPDPGPLEDDGGMESVKSRLEALSQDHPAPPSPTEDAEEKA